MTRRATRVLVTGASGLLGCRLAPHLAASGLEVVTHARSGAADERADLTLPSDARALVGRAKCDAIVHLVAATNVDRCEREPQEAYLLNVSTIANIVAAAHDEARPPHVVFISTDQVYDAPGDNPESAILLRNTYALSKLWGERIATDAGGTALRTNFFGKSHTPGRSSFTDWLIAESGRGRPMTLLTDVFFSPLSMDTLCRVIQRVLEAPVPGIFNAGSAHGMSKRDFSHAVAARLGLSLAAARDGTQDDLTLAARRPKGMMMDSGAFAKAFRLTLPSLVEEIHTSEL